MILTLDIGNIILYAGVFKEDELILQFRKTSHVTGSSDEIGVFLKNILRENGIVPSDIEQIAFCSVVPCADHSLRNSCKKYFNISPFELKAGVKTGLKIKYRNPLDVGSDRIANAIAATRLFPGKNLIIVDFGTATTFCVVSEEREYLGGVIFPGMQISMDVLENKTAKLPSVEIIARKKVVGRSTITSIQSGLYFGQIGVVKELKERITQESFGGDMPVTIGTGGFSNLFRETDLFDVIIPDLVLRGLKFALDLNTKQFTGI